MGRFLGEDTVAGKPVAVRFQWTNPAPARACWTQEFSRDNGESWQLNWIMELTAADGLTKPHAARQLPAPATVPGTARGAP